jgi:hypothetical protein
VVPATPWLDAVAPATPDVAGVEGPAPGGGREWALVFRATDAQVRWWVVRWRAAGGGWALRVVSGSERGFALRPGVAVDRIAVHAADAAWNLSAPWVWRGGGALATR